MDDFDFMYAEHTDSIGVINEMHKMITEKYEGFEYGKDYVIKDFSMIQSIRVNALKQGIGVFSFTVLIERRKGAIKTTKTFKLS